MRRHSVPTTEPAVYGNGLCKGLAICWLCWAYQKLWCVGITYKMQHHSQYTNYNVQYVCL